MHHRDAFEELYRRYHPGIYSYLLKFSKAATVTEDLVHDVFLKIWEGREKIAIRSSFSAYLYITARNRAMDYIRRMSLSTAWQDEMIHRMSLDRAAEVTTDDLQWRAYCTLLENAITTLSPQKRQAFILCRQLGKSYEETAAIMGISRNTLKEHLIIATRSIRQYLAEHGDITICLLLAEPFLSF